MIPIWLFRLLPRRWRMWLLLRQMRLVTRSIERLGVSASGAAEALIAFNRRAPTEDSDGD